jgi:hypothetical protein
MGTMQLNLSMDDVILENVAWNSGAVARYYDNTKTIHGH